jgi:hypothetical protein
MQGLQLLQARVRQHAGYSHRTSLLLLVAL